MSLRALLHSAAHQGDWSAEPERLGDLWLARQQQTRVVWENLASRCEEVRAAGGGGQMVWGHAALLPAAPQVCCTSLWEAVQTQAVGTGAMSLSTQNIYRL